MNGDPFRSDSIPRPLQPFLVNLIPIPFPPRLGVTQSRCFLKEFDVALQLVVSSDVLQMLANLLVDRLANGTKLLPGPLNKLLVDGEGDIHEHSICVHITRANAL